MWTLKCELSLIQDRSKWVWTLSQSELRSIQDRSKWVWTLSQMRTEIDLRSIQLRSILVWTAPLCNQFKRSHCRTDIALSLDLSLTFSTLFNPMGSRLELMSRQTVLCFIHFSLSTSLVGGQMSQHINTQDFSFAWHLPAAPQTYSFLIFISPSLG